ncbi:MAG: sulfatase [Verrucomicrobiota bacterium]
MISHLNCVVPLGAWVCLAAVGWLLLGGAFATAAEEAKPNIVLIVADDLGYGDLGCYGATTIATPRLDRMAKEGMRFTDFYVAAPFCSPSRAALLTGRLPARCGVPYVLFPAEHTGLPPDEVTIAEVLRERGYATACIGKWHLGWDQPLRPMRQGFDIFFGLPYSNDSSEWTVGEPFMQVMGLEPLPLMDGDRVVEAPVKQATLTKRYTERAVRFIRENRERPFFLYLPHTMPHIPQYASKEFAGKSKGGLYGDAVEEVDWSVGVILDTLRELKLGERTLVIFKSDNGAVVRPAQAAAKKAAPKSRFPGRDLGGSNGDLRGSKGTTFEGGIRVPCLAWWPGQAPAGKVISETVSAMDLLPSFAKLVGAKLSANRVLDGQDVSDLLRGQPLDLSGRMLFHYFGYQLQAVREGRWKLFVPVDTVPHPRPPSLWFEHQPQVFERQHRLWPKATLHDLSADAGEKNDVAAAHPDVVERLLKRAREYDARFQREKRAMEMLPGPKPPTPGQVRGD